MKCECGLPINGYNKIGICETCRSKDEPVKVRFVYYGQIYTCWSRTDYEDCLNIMKKEKRKFKVIEYLCPAKKVVAIKDLICGQNGVELSDAQVALTYALVDLFMVDIMKADLTIK